MFFGYMKEKFPDIHVAYESRIARPVDTRYIEEYVGTFSSETDGNSIEQAIRGHGILGLKVKVPSP